ncbi:MAG: Hsp70 family protein [bacterium]|nr:Hsp70 family protein [bacterium]
MGKTIGIDLGDTFIRIAYLDRFGQAKLISDQAGLSAFPSKASFQQNGNHRVGVEAEMFGTPENTVLHPMTIAGLSWAELQRLNERGRYEYKFLRERSRIVIDAHRVFPSIDDFLTLLFAHAKNLAEKYLKHEVDEAVVAVPDGAHDSKKIQIKRACELAGLQVKQLLNQTTAAALGYRFDKGPRKKIVVIDIGSSHTSMSVIEGGADRLDTVEVKHAGIGTNYFQELLAKFIADAIGLNESVQPSDLPYAMKEVEYKAAEALVELSTKNSVVVSIGGFGRRLMKEITRADFERCIGFVSNASREIKVVLSSDRIYPAQVNALLLIGGGANIPAIKRLVDSIYSKAPFVSDSVDPAYAVAMGAAVKGGILDGTIKSTSVERTVHDLGTFVAYDRMDVLIPKGVPLPVHVSKDYNLGMSRYTEKVYQWTGPGSGQDKREGDPHLKVLAKKILGVTGNGVRNTFIIDHNGVAKFVVTDKGSGEEFVLTGFDIN